MSEIAAPSASVIAFLFPGQGSQSVGMGKDLSDNFPVARDAFAEADDALGYSLSQLCFDGPEDQLKLTEYTQPAILAVSVAAARVLAEHGIKPAVSAGHSLGEYSAHVVAGTLGFADALRTVRLRGQYMQRAVPEGKGGMAAILGLNPERIADLCTQASDETSSIVAPANYNAPEQTVIAGDAAAVQRASDLCKEAGAKRCVPLPVSAPFHCKLMEPAAEDLASTLESVTFNDPSIPVASNVDARLLSRGTEVRDCLIRQVTGAVRWTECIDLLKTIGKATTYVEVGPARVLGGLLRQIDRGLPFTNVEDAASLEKTLTALRA